MNNGAGLQDEREETKGTTRLGAPRGEYAPPLVVSPDLPKLLEETLGDVCERQRMVAAVAVAVAVAVVVG